MAIEYSNVNQSRFIHIYVKIVCYIISFLSSVECAVFPCDFNVTEPVGFFIMLEFLLTFLHYCYQCFRCGIMTHEQSLI